MEPESKTITLQVLGNDTFIVKPDPAELCRLCANTDNQLIPIFKGEGLEHNIPSKLEKHLPIVKITETDKLPLQVCYQCASTLIAWHNLYEGCSVADKRLREILAVDEKLYHDEETFEDYGDDFRDDDFDQPHADFVQLNTASTSSQSGLGPNTSISEITQLGSSNTFDETENNNLADERKFEEFYIIEEFESLMEGFIDNDAKVVTFDSHGDSLFCRFCDASFSTVDHFNQHSCVSVTSEDACICDLCKKIFHSKIKLISHIRKTHNTLVKIEDQITRLPTGKFQCPICEKEFCRKLNASQHFMSHVSEKTVSCDSCDFKCYTKPQLDVHKAKHSKRFCCEFCSKMFTYKFQLEMHVKGVHYNMRPFTCTICNKTFKTRYNYGSHMAQHKDIRNFQCPYCPRRCRKNYDLKIHIRTHTGEKPFQCSFCQRCYSQNGDRLKHERHCQTKMHSAVEILVERYPDNDITDPLDLENSAEHR